MTTTVVIVADDYGLSPGVGAAIRDLLDRGRLSGTSCMTVFPEWDREGELLTPYVGRADLGLHLTLTDFAPVGDMPGLAPSGRFPSFPALLRRAWLGGVDAGEVYDELRRQVDRFVDVMGVPPDHVDGHHHVQQLPGVRDAVLKLVTQDLGGVPWVRTARERVGTILRRPSPARALAFSWMAGPLHREAREAGVRVPSGFAGAYDFSPRRPYEDWFRGFLAAPQDGMVVMCHPGEVDAVLAARDGLVHQRAVEWAALGSETMGRLLDDMDVTIGRMP